MDQYIIEAQQILEEKRALLKQTEQEQTFSVSTITIKCETCGVLFETENFMGIYNQHCPTCSEVREAEYQRQQAEQDRIQNERAERNRLDAMQRRITQNLNSCSIGERFIGMTFDDYKPSCDKAKKVLASCMEYTRTFSDKSGANIMMIGSPGTGKNMLAAIVCQEIIKKDFACLHSTAMKLVRKVKDSWRDKEQSEQKVIDSFVAPALLVIDEIGVQFGTPTEQLYLTEIINERYEKRRPTILISNLKLSQLTEVMGERVIDRFYDDGSKFLVFDWPSYRRNPHA